MGNFSCKQARVRLDRIGQTAVDDRQRQALNACENGERQLRGQQRMHSLQRGLRCRLADAFNRHAVVGGEHHNLRISESRLEGVLYQSQADCQRLKLAQFARGLAAPLELVAQRLLEHRVVCG